MFTDWGFNRESQRREDCMRKLLLVGLSAAALGAGAFAYASQAGFAPRPETFKELALFGDVVDIVERQYVVKVDEKKLIEAALDGMLSSLDPHSNYLNPTDFKDLTETSEGSYGGLGLEVTSEEGAVKVITPMDDTPAAKAGVQAGDYITAIDGQSIIGQTLTDAVKQMKGAPGSAVTITVARPGKDPFEVKLTREIIKVQSVKSRVEGDYGIIRITGFSRTTGPDTTAAIQKLKHDLPNLKGIVLDLRNNPGGLLDASVQVASDFLDGGEIVTQRERNPGEIERYNARPNGDLLKGVPVVVLVNNGTASAAEIVAGALKDRHRALIVGITSFGKGSVQTLIPLHNGEDGALKLTTARYYTPSGQSIQRTGIIPDLEVAVSKEQADKLADSKFQFSEASFKNALNADEGKVRRDHELTEYPPEAFDKKGDFQLSRAKELLGVHNDLAKLTKAPMTTVADNASVLQRIKSQKPADAAKPQTENK
jgi:carboxyl-terminal processing protease